MEALPREPLFRAAAIDLVAEQRVAYVRQVDADLVRAAGLQPAPQVRIAAVARDDLPMGDGAAPAGHDGHALAVDGVARYRCVHRAGVGAHPPAHDALVDAREAVIGELGAQGEVGGVVLRRDDQPRGVAVYAVDYPGPPLAAYPGERVPAVVHERVDKRAVRVPRRGVDDHTARLVDHYDVRVLVHDVERDVLGDELRLGGLRQLDGVVFAGGGFSVLLHGLAA